MVCGHELSSPGSPCEAHFVPALSIVILRPCKTTWGLIGNPACPQFRRIQFHPSGVYPPRRCVQYWIRSIRVMISSTVTPSSASTPELPAISRR